MAQRRFVANQGGHKEDVVEAADASSIGSVPTARLIVKDVSKKDALILLEIIRQKIISSPWNA